MSTKNIEIEIENISNKLDKIIELLEKKQEITYTFPSTWSHTNAVGTQGSSFPTPWNTPNTPVAESDILYRKPEDELYD